MATYWRSVESKCFQCNTKVGKISIKDGKICIDSLTDDWGGWSKVPQKSEMKVLCSSCQRARAKEQRRLKRRESLKNT